MTSQAGPIDRFDQPFGGLFFSKVTYGGCLVNQQ